MIFRAPIFLALQMMSQNWNHYNCSTSQTTEYIQDLPPVTFLDEYITTLESQDMYQCTPHAASSCKVQS